MELLRKKNDINNVKLCRLSFLSYAHQISVLSSHFTSVSSTASSAILIQQPLNFIGFVQKDVGV